MKKEIAQWQTNLGDKFRQTRLQRNIPLEKISEELKIRMKYLVALEANDFSSLPSSVYTKGFIKSYSSYLGLEYTTMMRLYMRQCPPTVEKVSENHSKKGMLSNFIPFINFRVSPTKGIIFLTTVFIATFLFFIITQFGTLFGRPSLIIKEPFFVDAKTASVYKYDTSMEKIVIQGEIEVGNKLFLNDKYVETYGLSVFELPIGDLKSGENTIVILTKNQFGVETKIDLKIVRGGGQLTITN